MNRLDGGGSDAPELDRMIDELRGIRLEVAELTLRLPERVSDEQTEFLRAFLQGQDLAIGAIPAETHLPTLRRLRDFRIPLVLAAVLTHDGQPWTEAGAHRVARAIKGASTSSHTELRELADRIVRCVGHLPRNVDPLRRHVLAGSRAVAEISASISGRGPLPGPLLSSPRLN